MSVIFRDCVLIAGIFCLPVMAVERGAAARARVPAQEAVVQTDGAAVYKAPDFDALGFELLGGRLLAGESGPVAQFMYQDAGGRRVTLYVRRAVAGNHETAFRHATENGVEVFYWIDRDFGYALSGQIAHADMKKLADAAYREMMGS